jgi:glycolate dehydrogenase iron-sulfur subunit
MSPPVRLRVDDDELVACVSCGLCLPHCPTYRVTGEESASPRGRITAMRAVHFGGLSIDDAFVEFMDLCVQCRACEAVCPSSVPFGHLMEGARETLVAEAKYQRWWRRAAYGVLGRHRLLLALSTVLALLQRLRLVPRRLGVPTLPLRRSRLRSSGSDVVLFTGCVMDAWMRETHAAVKRVVEATGAGVMLSPVRAGCCGALHAHAGLTRRAATLAERVIDALPPDIPVLVDSAGCGAVMKDYGRLVGTPESTRFAARVHDVHEWLAANETNMPAVGRRFDRRVAVQDPCHLRHVQRAEQHVRTVLGRYADIVDLDDDGLCCGAGGAYAAQHSEMAAAIRDRKVAAILRTGAPVVASANPGCAMHLAAAGLDVRHPLEIVDEVLHAR